MPKSLNSCQRSHESSRNSPKQHNQRQIRDATSTPIARRLLCNLRRCEGCKREKYGSPHRPNRTLSSDSPALFSAHFSFSTALSFHARYHPQSCVATAL
ncbi:hypothetical protein PsorP6_006210 [Peronosclerospora sorghi]|uniref:Uncharacterized protein n=1 Tax=Peronosclerospora sorghi TaxID=230839 RepID=A0ACC0W4B3_9STRA|nr:hypothetical protein PsorP6_006210 [Peronosclerospora sorghi]